MAENSGSGGEKGIGNKLFRKIGRTREKVMQTMGKADRTTDTEYDQLVNHFSEQHNVVNRLQKEVKNYMAQVKAMSASSQSMYVTISESYEGTWKNADQFHSATEELIALWVDRIEKLNDDLQVPLSKYAYQFRDLKKKIEKRGRKLMDFDGKRHTVESLENAKKRDETKISKALEDMYAAKTIYETIHNELCEELPALYQSRIPTLCNYFRSLVSSEAAFQTECVKIKTQLADLIKGSEAETAIVGRSPAVKRPSNKTPPRPPVVQRSIDVVHPLEKQQPIGGGGGRVNSEMGGDQSNEYLTLVEFGGNTTANRIQSDISDDENKDNEGRTRPVQGSSPSHSIGSAKKAASATSSIGSSEQLRGSNRELEAAASNPMTFHSSSSSLDSNPKNAPSRTDRSLAGSERSIDRKGSKASIEERLVPADKESKERGHDDDRPTVATEATENGKDSEERAMAEKKSSENVRHHESSSSSEEEEEEEEKKKKKKSTDGANYLYKVVAIHSYTAEDADELNFEKGDVIGILPFEELSEEQDEGWLFGVKSSTGEKGVFPINFTSRI